MQRLILALALALFSTAAHAQLPDIPGLPPCLTEQTQCAAGCVELGISTQAYFECICECALDACLCLQELDGVPDDVDACIDELGQDVCEAAFPTGLVQENPILPDSLVEGVYSFVDAPSGFWYDPPFATSLLYEMASNAKFLQINGFPTGFEQPFKVYVGKELIGSFEPGDVANFIDRGGVSSFVISDISPQIDTASPTAFPLRILFDQGAASFTMRKTPVPEPGGAAFAALTTLAWVARRRRAPTLRATGP